MATSKDRVRRIKGFRIDNRGMRLASVWMRELYYFKEGQKLKSGYPCHLLEQMSRNRSFPCEPTLLPVVIVVIEKIRVYSRRCRVRAHLQIIVINIPQATRRFIDIHHAF
jgi:hypothetical protein